MESTNQNSLKVPKVFMPPNKKIWLKSMSPPSLVLKDVVKCTYFESRDNKTEADISGSPGVGFVL